MSENQGRASGTSTPAKSPAPSSTPQAANVVAPSLASHAPSHAQVSQITGQNVQAPAGHMTATQAQHMIASQAQQMVTSQAHPLNPSQSQAVAGSQAQVIVSQAQQMLTSQAQQMLTSQAQQMMSQPQLMNKPQHGQPQPHVQVSHPPSMPQSASGQQPNQTSLPHALQSQMINIQHSQNPQNQPTSSQQVSVQHDAQSHQQPPPPQVPQPLPQQAAPSAPHAAPQSAQHVAQGGGGGGGPVNQVQQADGQQVSLMSMVANPGIAHQMQAGGVVRVTLPVNIQNMQGLQTMAGMQQLQQVQGMPHIQGVQQVQGVQQMPGLHQVQGIQQVQGVQGLHHLQSAQSFQGLPPGVQVLQNPQFLTQQQVLPGHQAIFQNPAQFHAFPGSVVSPAINIQHMQQQQQAGASKNQEAGVISQTALQQAQVQQGIQLQTQQSQQQQQQQQSTSQQQNSSSTSSTPSKVSIANSRPTHVVAGQPAAQQQLMGQKPMPITRQGQPVVIGQIGVISNQVTNNQTVINQQKSPIIAQANQTQVIGSPTQIRFQQNQGAFVNNPMIQPVMSMNQFQQIGMPGNISIAQPIFASQGTGQQVYLRPASINQPQQTVQVQVLNNKPKEVVQMKGAAVKTITPPIQGVLAAQGTRLQTVQMAQGPVRVATALSQVTPRMRPPVKVKTTSPRVIQPKPVISTVQSSPTHAPTMAVQPKVQNKVQPVTRVVTATTPPRITPVETKTSTSNPPSQDVTPTKALDSSLSSVVSTSPDVATSLPEQNEVFSGEPTKPSTVVTTVSSTTEPAPGLDLLEKKDIPSAAVTSLPVSSVLDPISKPVTEKKQAIVKPVLTHVIEGFVIQEAVEPFPIQRSNTMEKLMPVKAEEEAEKERLGLPKNALLPPVPGEEVKLQCEYCGNTAALRKFKNSKRFCSKLCAKRYSVGCSKRINKLKSSKEAKMDRTHKRPRLDQSGSKQWKRNNEGGRVGAGPMQREGHGQSATMGNSSQSDDDERQMHTGVETTSETESQMTTTTESSLGPADDSPSEPRSPPELERQVEVRAPAQGDGAYARKPITQWNVEDVATFIRSLPGCDIYVEEFTKQEIDGQALSLLKEDHLMSAMNIKLGPALKICASIKQFQEDG